ncbi:hypothetical protein [Sorangium sp. So ce406]|uniref:hypothetical protein n=1 Tax=Sorangium sp. So ce406 TaxID=3133311 RepID=UPI003F5C3A63
MIGAVQFVRRALLPAACLGVALMQAGDARAQAVKPVWASNTFQSSEHCDPQTKLLAGDYLNRGYGVYSANRKYHLIMQDDGNLVLYRVPAQALWSTGTAGQAIKHAILQADGNLVLYDYAGQPKWSSNTQGHRGAFLVVQCDGNLVIYAPT